jgi:hypothetical protein
MAHTFDMKRLHHGCGESLRSHLFEMMMKSLYRVKKRSPTELAPRSEGGPSSTSRDERFWG